MIESTTTATTDIDEQAQQQRDSSQKQNEALQALPSMKNRGKSLRQDINDMISNTDDTTNQQLNPFTPGMQALDSEEEYIKYEGRSPNHTFYIDYRNQQPANQTSSNKVYPEPGEGSSGTGEYPPKYEDTVHIMKQRETQASNTTVRKASTPPPDKDNTYTPE